MVYPSLTEISKAIKKHNYKSIPTLSNHEPEWYKSRLVCSSGGFAIAFPLVKAGNKIAFKVWYTHIDNLFDRMRCVRDYMKSHPLDCYVDFQLYSNALKVETDDGIQYLNAMSMQWIEGDNLKTYINKILKGNTSDYQKRAKLSKLRDDIWKLFEQMLNSKVSHGDLQHDNILVDSRGNIKLIDYDSFYVPNISNKEIVTRGYEDYQHPCIKKAKYTNEKQDYFSMLIIYLSLSALCEDFTIWDRYKLYDKEKTLTLKADDYQNIYGSELFNEMKNLSSKTAALCYVLENYLLQDDINKLQPFNQMLRGGVEPPVNNLSKYCIRCGRAFAFGDNYCIVCGNGRI